MSMKNSNDTIRNRTRNFPACSVVPQPNAPPCAPTWFITWTLIVGNRKWSLNFISLKNIVTHSFTHSQVTVTWRGNKLQIMSRVNVTDRKSEFIPQEVQNLLFPKHRGCLCKSPKFYSSILPDCELSKLKEWIHVSLLPKLRLNGALLLRP